MVDIKIKGTITIDDVAVEFDIVRTATTGRALMPHVWGDRPEFLEYAWIILRAMGHVDDDTTMIDAFERIDGEFAPMRAGRETEAGAGRMISDRMRATLSALDEYESCVDGGATMGEIEASGGARGVLYSAVDKGWADYYRSGIFPAAGEKVRRYYRTTLGSEVLEMRSGC